MTFSDENMRGESEFREPLCCNSSGPNSINIDSSEELCNAFAVLNDDDTVKKLVDFFGLDIDVLATTEQKGLKLIPEFKSGLRKLAEENNLNDTELIRRAVFAIAANPDLLRDPRVVKLDELYQERLYFTRWKKRGPRVGKRRPSNG